MPTNVQDDMTTMDSGKINKPIELDTDSGPGPGGSQNTLVHDPSDRRDISYELIDQKLVINLLPPFFQGGLFECEPGPDRLHALGGILRRNAPQICVINWGFPGKFDASELPTLPSTITELTLCDMPMFLRNPIPCKRRKDKGKHFVFKFAENLKGLEKLTLSRCGVNSSTLLRLRGWTGPLEIIVSDVILKSHYEDDLIIRRDVTKEIVDMHRQIDEDTLGMQPKIKID